MTIEEDSPPIQKQCPRCGTALCDTTVGQVICPRCELAGALGEPPGLPLSGAFGNYELESLIAHGGMGAVYRAYHRGTGKIVAVKTLLAGKLANSQMRERFLREIRLASQLRHPNIVPLLEVGDAEGLPFIAMEFIPGRNLADAVRDGPFRPVDAARVVEKAARGVAHAHEQGIIHRDIKPANILLDQAGEPRVADFGLARPIDEFSTELTLTGQILGSPAYLAPECVGRQNGSKNPEANGAGASIASDIYSLGATLYHLAAGRPPFLGASIEIILAQVLKTEPISLRKLNPSIPESLEAICLKCLEKEPCRRYTTARALAADLEHFLGSKPVKARLPGQFTRSWRWVKRRPVMAAFAATVLILLSAIVTISILASIRIQRDGRRLRAQLFDSLVAQAKAENRSSTAGKRDTALSAIARAAAIRPTLELRNEAIAALSRPDLVLRNEISKPRANPDARFIIDPDDRFFIYARGNELIFEKVEDGTIDFTIQANGLRPDAVPPIVFGGVSNRLCRVFSGLNQLTVWDWRQKQLVWQSAPILSTNTPSVILPQKDEILFSPNYFDLIHVDLRSNAVSNQGSLPVKKAKFFFSLDGRRLFARLERDFWVAEFPGLEWAGFQAPLPIIGDIQLYEGSKIGWALDDHSFWFWDVETAKPVGRLAGHAETGTADKEPSSRWIVTSGNDGTTRLWDSLSFQQEIISPVAGAKIHWSSSFERFRLKLHGSDGLRWFDFQRPKSCLALVPKFENTKAELAPPSLNASGRILAATTEDCVNLMDTLNGRILANFKLPKRGRVTTLFEPNDRALLCSGGDGVYRFPLHRATGDVLQVGPPETLISRIQPQNMATDASGKWLAVSDINGVLRLRNPSGNWSLIRHKAGGVRVALSPNGKLLAAGAFNEDWLRVWDTDTCQLVREFKTAIGVTPGFTPQGQLFAATSTEFILWNQSMSSPQNTIPRGYSGRLRGEAIFSADGKMMAFACSRTRVDLLRLPDFQILASFEALDNSTSALALDLQGKELIIGKAGQFFERWDLRALRSELASLNLDWNLPSLPSEASAIQKSLRISMNSSSE